MIKPKAKRRQETMDLNDAVQLVMRVRRCTAQQAINELLEAWRDGELPILADELRKAETMH